MRDQRCTTTEQQINNDRRRHTSRRQPSRHTLLFYETSMQPIVIRILQTVKISNTLTLYTLMWSPGRPDEVLIMPLPLRNVAGLQRSLLAREQAPALNDRAHMLGPRLRLLCVLEARDENPSRKQHNTINYAHLKLNKTLLWCDYDMCIWYMIIYTYIYSYVW